MKNMLSILVTTILGSLASAVPLKSSDLQGAWSIVGFECESGALPADSSAMVAGDVNFSGERMFSSFTLYYSETTTDMTLAKSCNVNLSEKYTIADQTLSSVVLSSGISCLDVSLRGAKGLISVELKDGMLSLKDAKYNDGMGLCAADDKVVLKLKRN